MSYNWSKYFPYAVLVVTCLHFLLLVAVQTYVKVYVGFMRRIMETQCNYSNFSTPCWLFSCYMPYITVNFIWVYHSVKSGIRKAIILLSSIALFALPPLPENNCECMASGLQKALVWRAFPWPRMHVKSQSLIIIGCSINSWSELSLNFEPIQQLALYIADVPEALVNLCLGALAGIQDVLFF